MKKVSKILVSALCIAVMACVAFGTMSGCGNTENTVIVSGSTSVEAIMTPLAGEYEKTHDVRINISANGSGVGIEDTAAGRNEIGMSSRILKESELTRVDGRYLCTDGIVLVVSKNCPVDEVTNDEIFNLYVNGTAITQGTATVSVAVGREPGSGTRDGFDENIYDADGKAIKNNYSYSGANEFQSTGSVISAIAGDANNRTVGYVSMGSYLKNTDKLKALRVKARNDSDYVAATKQTILDGTYKLQRPFVIVTRKDKAGMSAAAKEFYDWLFGTEAENIIKAAGYVIKK